MYLPTVGQANLACLSAKNQCREFLCEVFVACMSLTLCPWLYVSADEKKHASTDSGSYNSVLPSDSVPCTLKFLNLI